MVIRKNLKDKYVLVSVFEKNKLKYLCSNLSKYNYKFISSGSTGKKIRELGFKCYDVSKITKFKEMFDGRVKTLNHLLYSSLLYKRENKIHEKQFFSLNIPKIDIVIVNLYPFEKMFKKDKKDYLIDMIDIGGPSLLRAASKNYKYITPVMFVKDYSNLVKNLNKNNGVTDISFRKNMALKVFQNTSAYDKIIAKWLNEKK